MWWLKSPAHLRVVIVNLKDNPAEAIRGVWWGQRGNWIQLRDATLLRAPGEPSPLDGEVIVHRSNVAFVQVVP